MVRADFLDGWRGLAISLVLVAHFGDLGRILGMDLGRLGVDLFFVLSGLLMSQILFENRTPLLVFYRRRISRILPAFFVYVVVIYSISTALGRSFSPTELISSLLFLRTYVQPGIWESSVEIHHLWSLNVEEHSYILLAAVAAIPILRRRAPIVLIALALLTYVAIRLYMARGVTGSELRTECAATWLLLSAGYRQIAPRVQVPPWLPIAALVFGVACYHESAHWAARLLASPFLLAFAVNHIGDAYSWAVGCLRFSPLRYLGLWSYSLYLWQQPFYLNVGLKPLAFGLAMLCGLASYYALENPARKWLNANWGKSNLSTDLSLSASRD
jgi:peptidoglycan/LPS O-acetylase OafA/YrhL